MDYKNGQRVKVTLTGTIDAPRSSGFVLITDRARHVIYYDTAEVEVLPPEWSMGDAVIWTDSVGFKRLYVRTAAVWLHYTDSGTTLTMNVKSMEGLWREGVIKPVLTKGEVAVDE